MTPEVTHADPRMLAEVRAGLSRAQKELPSRYFYDARGSALFEAITRLPEYYPTRTERALLARQMPLWAPTLAARTVVELGAGSAAKTRLVLDALRARGTLTTYVPVDVSGDFLAAVAAELRVEYHDLRVTPVVADFMHTLHLPADLPRPVLVAFLGSTIGNFTDDAATLLLQRVASAMHPGDHLLLGVDLEKDVAVLEAAYDDAAGVTAEFNRNILHVLDHALGADFDASAFAHRAHYDRAAHRIEMHLVARTPQTVLVPGAGTFHFAAGESVRTEISCKYTRERIEALLAAAGLRLDGWETDERDWYALALASRDATSA